MAINAGQVFIDVLPNTTKFGTALTSQVSGAAKASEAAATKSTSAWAKFGKTIQQNSVLIGAVLAGAIVKFGVEAVRAASDTQESMNKVKVVFGDTATAVEQFASTSAESFGISEQAALETSASFGNLFLAAGLSQEAAAGMSVQMVQLAADMASFNNVDPSETLAKLRSGLAGQSRPLRVFGVLLSETAVKEEAYASGIAVVGSELTDQQKVQARYNIIMRQTAIQQGDFARTSGGLANQQRILAATMADLAAKVGKSLLPVIEAVIPLIVKFVDLVSGPMAGAFTSIAQNITDASDMVSEFASGIQRVIDLLPDLKLPEVPADQQSGWSNFTDTLGKFAKGGVFTQIKLFGDKIKELFGGANDIQDATFQVRDYSTAFDVLGESAASSAGAQVGAAGAAAVNADAMQKAAVATANAAAAAKDLKEAEQALAGGLLGVASGVAAIREDQRALNQLRKDGKKDTKAYRDAEFSLLQDADALNGTVREQIATWKEHGLSLKDAVQKVIGIGTQFGLTAKEARDVLGPALDTLKHKYDVLPSSKKTTVEIVDKASAALAAIQRRVDALARTYRIDIITNTSGSGQHGGPQSEHGGYIPGAAMGGFVSRDQVIRVGEHSKPEMILPLQDASGIAALTKALERAGAGNKGSGRLHVISGRVDLDTGQIRIVAREEIDDDRSHNRALALMA